MTTLTPAIIQAFADAARRGVPVQTTLDILDIPKQTFYEWLRLADQPTYANGHHPSESTKSLAVRLSGEIRRAQAEAEAEAIEKLRNWRSSKTGDDDWRQHAWYLTHGPARERWYEHKQTTVNQTIDVHHAHSQVRELPDDELQALRQRAEQKALEQPRG